jgi:hypothetical protein
MTVERELLARLQKQTSTFCQCCTVVRGRY